MLDILQSIPFAFWTSGCETSVLNSDVQPRSTTEPLRRRKLVPSPTNQRTASQWRGATMAETMKQDGSRAPANEFSKMSSYRECVCATLKLLAEFGKEVGWATWPESPVGFLFFFAGLGPLAHANVFSIPALRAAAVLSRQRMCCQHVEHIDVQLLLFFFLFFSFLRDSSASTAMLSFLCPVATCIKTANSWCPISCLKNVPFCWNHAVAQCWCFEHVCRSSRRFAASFYGDIIPAHLSISGWLSR